ncbi:right-handed parallel beta-helix repeat-containing protein [Herpetosiphon llansteffanensis]|uniref:right-handed parallel beta-helix repeat-containing protein n=1 Tax=Herpetosiphon llansteffanensis TaxID=2094568 RepID=UPI000D7BB0A0|nr:right-handed parallel beta-helix repeat-containing protein [Herpetosiphon llansteffanensis]
MLRRKKIFLSGLIVLGLAQLWQSQPVAADSVVVGTGTPASCTEAAFDAGLAQLYPGEQAPGGTLSFNCGPNPHTIVLSSQKFLHDGSVIDGGSKITLSGGNTTRIFWVSQQARVEIQRITLSNGFADHSAAIFAEPNWSGDFTNLTLNQVTIKNNRASQFGGGIGSQHTNMLIIDSLIEANQSSGSGGGLSFNTGTLTVRNSKFTSNKAETEGAGLEAWTATLDISQTNFDINELLGHENTDFGGGMVIRQSHGVIQAGRIWGNTAGQGGGIYLREGGVLEVNTSNLVGNVAFYEGGAAYVATNAGLTIKHSTVDINLSALSGGGISNKSSLIIERSTLTRNDALSGDGGALDNSGFAVISYSTIASNDAQRGAGLSNRPNGTIGIDHVTMTANAAESTGGGIYHAGTQFTVNNSIIMGNGASAGAQCGYASQAPSMSFSMWNDGSCGTQASNGNLPNTWPVLYSLGWYGGPTQTYLPRADSESVDAGSCSSSNITDQRGLAGFMGAACDMGAVESGALWYQVALPMTMK